ncbi:MAG: pyridoxal phosphate-dependent aminotransferase [Promethearchaeota archaeon]
MKSLSKKLVNVPKSGIRKLFDLLSNARDVISLGIGQPDFSTQQEVIQGSIRALEEGKGSVYAPTRGVPEFKELISKKFKQENDIDLDPSRNVIVTNGGSGSITLAFAAILNPGDEILLSSPNFVSYFYVSKYFEANVNEIPRREDLGPDLERMKSSINEKTKAILINSPNNPTGYTLERKELEEICTLCVENDLYLISDEVYEKYVYDGRKHVSPASLNGMAERTITLNALSKTFSTTGFRVGYLSANEEVVSLMENFLQYTGAGVNHPCQYGGIAAMQLTLDDPNLIKDIVNSYKARRDLCHARLNEMGLSCPKPGGAFYIMPSVKESGLDGNAFSEKLVEKKSLAVVPGKTFGQYSRDRIRISYALQEEKLLEAMDRLSDFMKEQELV